MSAPERMPSNVYLAPAHLNHIRATIDWQAMFEGLGLKRDSKKSKFNDWWALSPFQQERTPSFHMGPGGIWYDFSSGQGGGPLELIQQLNSWNCYEAAHHILECGWASNVAAIRQTETQTRAKVEEASELPKNEPIRQDLLPMCTYHPYLEKRGISEATCKALGIGYLPQGRSPLRGRVVFQIRDARLNKDRDGLEGVILSHFGRSIDAERKPKYLFYEGFQKSHELYGQDILLLDGEARRQMKETGQIILTEGSMDVAKCYEAGIKNVIASFGCRLSKEQLIRLKHIASRNDVTSVLIAFDRDGSGKSASSKAATILADFDVSIFEWERSFSGRNEASAHLPKEINDIADFSTEQLSWLRRNSYL